MIIDIPITDKNGVPLEIGDKVIYNRIKCQRLLPNKGEEIIIPENGIVMFGVYNDGESYYDMEHLGVYIKYGNDSRVTYPDAKESIIKVVD